MSDIFGKCGVNCSRCPWSQSIRMTVKTDVEYQEFCKKCKKVVGYGPTEKFSNCVGCQTPDEEIPKGSIIPLKNCLMRQCTTKMGIDNCAYCSRFPCGYIRDAGTEWSREQIEARHGKPIPEEDYLTFVEPFDRLKHLNDIRAKLSSKDIVEAVTIPPFKPKIKDFPADISFSKEEITGFQALHRLLVKIKESTLDMPDTDTFAQQMRLKRRIPHFLRFLWILGRFGEFKDENGGYIVVDAMSFIDNRGNERTLGDWNFVEKIIIKVLLGFGVHSKLIPMDKEWKTKGGALRKEGWELKISFDKAAGGVSALTALRTYSLKLDEKFGKKAFKFFSNVDMSVLAKE
jgi:hypothetical protein